MRKRIGIYSATDEARQLIPSLLENPELEIAAIVDPDAESIRQQFGSIDSGLVRVLDERLTSDVNALLLDANLHAVVDASSNGDFAANHPALTERGIQIVTPLTARLLWCFSRASRNNKGDLLTALHEIVESYNLTIDADELFSRVLEIAVSVTGAEGGSLMLLDHDARELRVRVAAGVEPELWPKIRVPLGHGIAGRVAADGRSLRLRGKADRQAFQIVRERLDVESAISVPLIFEGRVLGVLNLHHSTQTDAFSDESLEFAEQLAHLDAQIIARSQEHEALRSQAARYTAVRRVREILAAKDPLFDRLRAFCLFVAEQVGHGIATLYLRDNDEPDLRLSATSLEGGGFGGEYRIEIGRGIDGTAARNREPAILRSSNGALAYAALPLIAGDHLFGVLSVQGGDEAAGGRAAEETLLEIAAAAAEEIAHVEREANMTARANKTGALNEAGIRMISATDPAEVLRMATSSAAMALGADHAILRIQDDETRRYVIRSYFGSADGRLQEQLFRLDKQISVEVIKKRAPRLIADLADDPAFADLHSEFRSVIAAPLMREGCVIGTLTIYDKVLTDRFYVGRFPQEDLVLFTKFVSYVERAVTNADFYARARQFRNFDTETNLPNERYLDKRIDDEIARASGHEGALAIAVCLLENLDEIKGVSGSGRAREVVQRTVDALRAHLRDFDVMGRSENGEFTILLPDPGYSAGERVYALARAVADDLSKDSALNDPIRIALAFGYALYPIEGTDRQSLLAHARTPRIRMV
ncbi:MAG: GAF domain-containing protein [Deltaproteobacteria bacterium]|nr:GAF domain-containing protein [Deltaproteobacteria bacterium]